MTSILENAAYTIGWICADYVNRVAAHAMLDEEHGRPQTRDSSDDNSYLLGKIGHHNVVIACLPEGVKGMTSAAATASKLLSSFHEIRIGVLVGTGGGIPSDEYDIRLGDVAVSIPGKTFGGVVQFDMGKAVTDGFIRTGSLNKPPTALLTAITEVRATHDLRGSHISEYLSQMHTKYPRLVDTYSYPGTEKDRLFSADYPHQDEADTSCKKCRRKAKQRPPRETIPYIHYGIIASSNTIVEDSLIRDQLAEEYGAICVETEAAGLMDNFPCVIIRGICNYADSHRKGAEGWRRYASAAAAACSKELLQAIQVQDVIRGPLAVDILSELSVVQNQITSLVKRVHVHGLPTVSGAAYDSHSKEPRSRCHPQTRVQLLRDVMNWASDLEGKTIFWLSGSAGTGKSTISRTLAHSFHGQGQLAASFFFKKGEVGRGDATGLFTTIATQLASSIPETGKYIQKAVEDNPSIADKVLSEQFNTLILQPILQVHDETSFDKPRIIVLDALDECESREIGAILQILRETWVTKASLRFFVTSRPDFQVLDSFGRLPKSAYQDTVLQNILEEVTRSDLRTFLTHELKEIRESHNRLIPSSRRHLPLNWPGKQKISSLVDMATPLFIFAATTCRFLSDPKFDPDDRLATILKYRTASHTLYKTYMPVLDQLIGDDDTDDERDIVVRRFRNIVGAIILLLQPLSAHHLTGLLNLRPGEIDLQLVFLHSVLQIPRDNSSIRLLHLSFRDFLTDNRTRAKTPFWIDQKKRHLCLANQCLERMNAAPGLTQDICKLNAPGFLSKEVDPGVIEKYIPGDLHYACIYWVDHLVKGDGSIRDGDFVHQFLKTHFLHWIEALSLLGTLSKGTAYIGALLGLAVSETNGGRLSAFLLDARRFLLYNFSTIEEAPLQTYSSALMFCPSNCLLRNTFGKGVPDWVVLPPNTTDDWSPLEQTFDTPSPLSYHAPAFSPDGTKLACGSLVWDVTSSQQIRTPSTESSRRVEFLSDHEVIMVAKDQPAILNLNTGQITNLAMEYSGKCISLESVALDRSRLILIREESPISPGGVRIRSCVYNIDTEEAFQSDFSEPMGHNSRVLLSKDGRRMAFAGERLAKNDEPAPAGAIRVGYDITSVELEVWRPEDAKQIIFSHVFSDLRSVGDFAISPNGEKLALLCLVTQRVRVVQLNGDGDYKTLKGQSDRISCLAFSPDGNMIAFGSSLRACLWDLDTDRVEPILENVDCKKLLFSPDGHKLAIKTKSRLKICDLRAEFSNSPHANFYKGSIKYVVFSPCGTMVASRSEHGGGVLIWDVSNRKVTHKLEMGEAISMGFSPRSDKFFVGSEDLLAVWHIRSGRFRLAYSTKLEGRAMRPASFSSDGTMILLCTTTDGLALQLLDARTGQGLVMKRLGWQTGVISVKFSKDGSKLAVARRKDHVKQVELRDGRSLTFKKKWVCTAEQEVGQVAFSADEKLILFEDGVLFTTAWELSANRTLTVKTSTKTGQRIFISKNGRWILPSTGTKMLCLPSEIQPTSYVPRSTSVHGNMVAIGNENGHLTIMEFEFGDLEEDSRFLGRHAQRSAAEIEQDKYPGRSLSPVECASDPKLAWQSFLRAQAAGMVMSFVSGPGQSGYSHSNLFIDEETGVVTQRNQ
ncbi:hypothetical protein BDV12DRAFT_179306 [Aspergillus spectabilis]